MHTLVIQWNIYVSLLNQHAEWFLYSNGETKLKATFKNDNIYQIFKLYLSNVYISVLDGWYINCICFENYENVHGDDVVTDLLNIIYIIIWYLSLKTHPCSFSLWIASSYFLWW